MGTVKYSGPVASFHCPTDAEIRSLKVHFSPKQEGSGDPSPENVRAIVGWDGVVVHNDDGIVVPEEYQKVEYLQSTGTQYFWTNINIQDGLTVDSIQTAVTQDSYLFGGISSGGTMCFNGTWNTTVQGSYPSTYYNISGVIVYNKIHHIITTHKNGRRTVIVDGNTVSDITSGNGITDTQDKCVCFGARKSDGTVFQFYKGNLYSLKVLKDSTLLANFVPCRRKSDNKPGMYDTVTQTFFTNQGTGEFICGPDVGQTTDYEFGVLGKNKFDKDAVTDYYRINNSGEITAQNGMSISDYIPVIPGQQYTLTNEGSFGGNKRHAYYDENKNYIRVIGTYSNPMTFTVPNNVYYLRLSLYNDYLDTTQLELGSTPTTYEPYNPNHTVYGGWVDLITGEVCEEKIRVIIDGTQTIQTRETYTNANAFRITKSQLPIESRGYHEDDMASYMMIATTADTANPQPWLFYMNTSSHALHFYFPKSYNLAAVQQYFQEHPLQCCYHIMPITYSLAPTQLQTFLGQNNVWSNADYVEVEYDLHETQTLLQRKAFIMANQPHIESASGAIASFNTDLRAPLKECKAYFSPKQDLHGYSNPWPAGGGKNLFDASQIGTSTSAAFITLQLVAGTTYTFSSNKASGAGGFSVQTTNTNLAESGAVYENHPITFTAVDDAEISIRYYNGSTTSLKDYWYQLEKGSTATSYVPYENVCTISGWDGIDIAYSGKNLLPNNIDAYHSTASERTINQWFRTYPTGGIYVGANAYSSFVIPAPKGNIYCSSTNNGGFTYLSLTNELPNPNVALYYSITMSNRKNCIIDNSNGYKYLVVTVGRAFEEDQNFIADRGLRIYTNSHDDFTNAYGTIIPLSWQSTAGTIYGGYVDLVNEEIVQTYYKIIADGVNVKANSKYWSPSRGMYGGGIVYIDPIGKYANSSLSNIFCDILEVTRLAITDHQHLYVPLAGKLYTVFYLFNISDTETELTKQEVIDQTNAWLQEHPTTIIYELTEPIHYSLTPIQLKTLRGTNNIWSSANGNIELKFYKH